MDIYIFYIGGEMDLKQLQYFAAIVEEGTISAAARRLHVSQPPVSLQMRLLEEEYGTPLFIRGRRNITLTEAGKTLYRYAVDILTLKNAAEDDLLSLRSGGKKKIRLGLISSFSCQRLSEGFAAFRRIYPDTAFEIHEKNTYALLHMLREGRIDLAVLRTPYPDQDFEAADLSVDVLHAAGQDSALFSGKTELTVQDLQDCSLMIYRRWEEQINEAFNAANLQPHFCCVMDDARTCLQMASEGIGTALVPGNIITESVGLFTAPVSGIGQPSHLRLVRRRDHAVSDSADLFFRMFTGAI